MLLDLIKGVLYAHMHTVSRLPFQHHSVVTSVEQQYIHVIMPNVKSAFTKASFSSLLMAISIQEV